jgi:hypothetical protein
LKHWIRYIIIAFGLYPSIGIHSQDNEIDAAIEIILKHQIEEESNEDSDLASIYDQLEFIREHPININSSNLRKLIDIGLINFYQYTQVKDHIEKYGRIMALEELIQIEAFDASYIRILKPFIHFEGLTDIKSKEITKIVSSSKSDLTFQYQQVIQKSKAYSKLTPIYIGSPARIMVKFSSKFYKRWRIGFNLEKDAGESISFSKEQSKLGFDHSSIYISYSGKGIIRSAILGDFQCGFGQGLTFWRGFSFGKSSNTVPIRKVNAGIRPHTGLDEYNFLRGSAISLAKNKWGFTSFLSFRDLDASKADSSQVFYTTIIKNGYHRSISELDKSKQIKEILYGSSLTYSLNRLTLGFSYALQTLNSQIKPREQLYTHYYFNGNRNYNLGLDFSYSFKNGHTFGELSYSENNTLSYLLGTVLTLDPAFSISLLTRNYRPSYQAIASNAFAETSGNRNEVGNYIGVEYAFSRRILLNSFVDIFHSPWIKSSTKSSSEGMELLSKISYKKSKRQLFSISYRFKKAQLNGIAEKHSYQLRLNYEQAINSILRLRYRLEFHRVNFTAIQMGYLFFVDFILQSPERPFSINARYALFNTDSYETRIYAYERDVYFAYSIKPYFYQGQKIYVNAKWRLRRFFTFVFRLSHLQYPYLKSIGSGNDLIENNKKTEFTCQLRIRW